MKKTLRFWMGLAAALALGAVFAMVFVTYAQPMENRMYDLSFVAQDGEAAASEEAAQDWTVFIRNGDEVTLLEPDGYGGYNGLTGAGQTFYFSRVMSEELDAATLQLGTADRSFAVFLDDELIYTDCPEADNRIGYLTLPQHGWDRMKDVTVSLPDGYVGKTLTIAQSTPEIPETPRMAKCAVPCSVRLYCGYAYESSLIAESFRSAALGAMGYATGLCALIIFALVCLRGRFDTGLLLLALTIFLAMAARLYNTSYALQYFGIPSLISAAMLCQQAMSAALLAFLSTRMKKLQWAAWVMTGLSAVSLALFFLLGGKVTASNRMAYFLVWHLPRCLIFLSLWGMVLLSALQRRSSRFHRFFSPAVLLGVLLYLLGKLILPGRSEYFRMLLTSLRSLTTDTVSYQLSWLMMAVSFAIVMLQFIRGELDRYAEKKLAIARSEMTRQSYENLRTHNEEVMMLRHDMNRHFQYLRSVAEGKEAIRYLDGLIGLNEKIRPVIQSGNEMLDVIIGSRAATAQSSGVSMRILRAEAPRTLPLADVDLCSLMMNLLDNAVSGACRSGSSEPYISVDLHIKNDFFVFVCENSAAEIAAHPSSKKETVPKHGLGLKIVQNIAEKYDILLRMTQKDGSYKAELAIQLGQPDK